MQNRAACRSPDLWGGKRKKAERSEKKDPSPRTHSYHTEDSRRKDGQPYNLIARPGSRSSPLKQSGHNWPGEIELQAVSRGLLVQRCDFPDSLKRSRLLIGR